MNEDRLDWLDGLCMFSVHREKIHFSKCIEKVPNRNI